MVVVPRILAFAGSLREGSFNKKLVRIAAQGARAAGAEVTYLDLRELNLPLLDEDLHQREGLPPGAKQLKELMKANHGLLISAPEYNSSISAALKNAIDWASRREQGEPPLAAFTDKVCALLAASPGYYGGIRGLLTVRVILGNIGVIVLPRQLAVPKADQAFGEDGNLKDPKQQQIAQEIGALLAQTIAKLRA